MGLPPSVNQTRVITPEIEVWSPQPISTHETSVLATSDPGSVSVAFPTREIRQWPQLLKESAELCLQPCLAGIVPGRAHRSDIEALSTQVGASLHEENPGQLSLYGSGSFVPLYLRFFLVPSGGDNEVVGGGILVANDLSRYDVLRNALSLYTVGAISARIGNPDEVYLGVQPPFDDPNGQWRYYLFLEYTQRDLIAYYEAPARTLIEEQDIEVCLDSDHLDWHELYLGGGSATMTAQDVMEAMNRISLLDRVNEVPSLAGTIKQMTGLTVSDFVEVAQVADPASQCITLPMP